MIYQESCTRCKTLVNVTHFGPAHWLRQGRLWRWLYLRTQVVYACACIYAYIRICNTFGIDVEIGFMRRAEKPLQATLASALLASLVRDAAVISCNFALQKLLEGMQEQG